MSDLVIVSPHLDDAVLSVYGLLDPSATVVTVFAGLPPAGMLGPWDAGSGAADSRARIAERREEDAHALERSGAAHVHLDLLDRQYIALGAAPPPTVDDVAGQLRPYLETAERVFAPSALSAGSRNPLRRRRRRRRPSDHRTVRDAVLALRPDASLYADLPYALTADRGFALPADVDERGRLEHRHVLEGDVLADKLDSLRCYATQISPLEDVFGPIVTPDAMRLEVWWEPIAV